MRAGQLRHRVTIQAPTRADTASGQRRITGWTDVDQVWAAVRPLSARELAAYQQASHTVTHEVTIRYRDDVTADCRIVHQGRTLNISGIRDIDERHIELRIQAAEVTPPAGGAGG